MSRRAEATSVKEPSLPQERLGQAAIHRNHVAGRPPAPAAGEPEDGLRAQFRRDRLVQQRAARVEPRQLVAQIGGAFLLAPLDLYFVSDDTTRSRGNIVDPATTVAGAIAFTRTDGASRIASSRTR